ncbi:hypothetical protein B0H15DRAFT_806618 [Mycena belliarum]|uniref:Uncharacterized protein n=1 Tax=Mycena belliarum TaxID=1033014 RepID=A0AAD6XEQ7_9AGAR|nr:hypothetical protein B0H15DRAFT_806618 [Mycena belliae]
MTHQVADAGAYLSTLLAVEAAHGLGCGSIAKQTSHQNEDLKPEIFMKKLGKTAGRNEETVQRPLNIRGDKTAAGLGIHEEVRKVWVGLLRWVLLWSRRPGMVDI